MIKKKVFISDGFYCYYEGSKGKYLCNYCLVVYLFSVPIYSFTFEKLDERQAESLFKGIEVIRE